MVLAVQFIHQLQGTSLHQIGHQVKLDAFDVHLQQNEIIFGVVIQDEITQAHTGKRNRLFVSNDISVLWIERAAPLGIGYRIQKEGHGAVLGRDGVLGLCEERVLFFTGAQLLLRQILCKLFQPFRKMRIGLKQPNIPFPRFSPTLNTVATHGGHVTDKGFE